MKRKLLARYRFAFFWVLSALIFLAGVVGAGAWYYRNQKENLRAEVWEDLQRCCRPEDGGDCRMAAIEAPGSAPPG